MRILEQYLEADHGRLVSNHSPFITIFPTIIHSNSKLYKPLQLKHSRNITYELISQIQMGLRSDTENTKPILSYYGSSSSHKRGPNDRLLAVLQSCGENNFTNPWVSFKFSFNVMAKLLHKLRRASSKLNTDQIGRRYTS